MAIFGILLVATSNLKTSFFAVCWDECVTEYGPPTSIVTDTNIPVELVALLKWANCTIVAFIENSTSTRMTYRKVPPATTAAVILGTTSSFLSGFDLMIPFFDPRIYFGLIFQYDVFDTEN